MTMDHRQYGRSGLRVSALSLGAMTFGEAKGFMKGVHADDAEARKVFETALEAGMDTVDTANGYARYEGIQLQWNLIARDAERELIPAAKTFGLGVLVWSPLGRGFLSGKYRKGQPPPAGTRLEAWKDSWAMTATDQNWRTLDKVLAVAQRHDTTPASVALAWLLAKPEVSSVIVGARNLQQLQDNLRALQVKLTPA